MRRIRKRLTCANVTASIALFLALGGATALAARQLPRNSVGPRQLQPNAVRTGFLDRNAVRTGKIAFEAVRAGKVAKNAVVTNRLRDGTAPGARRAWPRSPGCASTRRRAPRPNGPKQPPNAPKAASRCRA